MINGAHPFEKMPQYESTNAEQMAVQKVTGLVTDLQKTRHAIEELLRGDKLNPKNTAYQSNVCFVESTDISRPGLQMVGNTDIRNLLYELVDMAFQFTEEMKMFKTWLILTESKVTTGNDMTMQARATLVAEANTAIDKLSEVRQAACCYWSGFRLELGKLCLKQPGLRDEVETSIRFGEYHVIQNFRLMWQSTKAQYDIIYHIWHDNVEALTKLRTNDHY